jgi:hypothetical protein
MMIRLLTLALAPVALLVGQAPFSAKSIAYQPLPRLEKLLGPQIVLHHVPGLYFNRPGFDKVWVNAAGPDMNLIVLRPKRLMNLKQTAAMFGIDVSHATAKPQEVAKSPIPLERNVSILTGAKGLPLKTGSNEPWQLAYRETAVVNKAKLRAHKADINAAVGQARMSLIRGCYDWYSEIDLRKG